MRSKKPGRGRLATGSSCRDHFAIGTSSRNHLTTFKCMVFTKWQFSSPKYVFFMAKSLCDAAAANFAELAKFSFSSQNENESFCIYYWQQFMYLFQKYHVLFKQCKLYHYFILAPIKLQSHLKLEVLASLLLRFIFALRLHVAINWVPEK